MFEPGFAPGLEPGCRTWVPGLLLFPTPPPRPAGPWVVRTWVQPGLGRTVLELHLPVICIGFNLVVSIWARVRESFRALLFYAPLNRKVSLTSFARESSDFQLEVKSILIRSENSYKALRSSVFKVELHVFFSFCVRKFSLRTSGNSVSSNDFHVLWKFKLLARSAKLQRYELHSWFSAVQFQLNTSLNFHGAALNFCFDASSTVMLPLYLFIAHGRPLPVNRASKRRNLSFIA